MTEEFLPETVRVEEFWGTISYELLQVCPDAARQELQYRTRVRVDYDLQKIEDYVLEGLKPLTAKDMPNGWKEILGLFGPIFDNNQPLTLLGKRLYIVDGDMRHWEYKKQYELMKERDDGKGENRPSGEGDHRGPGDDQ